MEEMEFSDPCLASCCQRELRMNRIMRERGEAVRKGMPPALVNKPSDTEATRISNVVSSSLNSHELMYPSGSEELHSGASSTAVYDGASDDIDR